MNIAEILLDTALSDHALLRGNRDKGDDASIPRDLDFVFYADDEERAALVCDFVADNKYGRSSYQRLESPDGKILWRVLVVIRAPASAEIVCTLSGFMACLAAVFSLEYDGWGCVLQTKA